MRRAPLCGSMGENKGGIGMGKAIIYLADGTEECEALLCADLLRNAVRVLGLPGEDDRGVARPFKILVSKRGFVDQSRIQQAAEQR